MRVGDLTQRVTIEKRQVARNDYSDETITWVPVTTVWASVTPLRGQEYMAARMAQSDITVKVVMRYHGGLNTTMRLRHRGQVLNIISIINTGFKDQWLEVMCAGDSEPT